MRRVDRVWHQEHGGQQGRPDDRLSEHVSGDAFLKRDRSQDNQQAQAARSKLSSD